MGKEKIIKELVAELEDKLKDESPEWTTGFKAGMLYLAKLFEEDAAVLKYNQKTEQYLDGKIEKLWDKLKHQPPEGTKDIQKGFDATYTFAERFRAQKDWEKKDRSDLYDAILGLFAIPIPEERHK